jgi:peptide/nickel transport system ATP-binding protein
MTATTGQDPGTAAAPGAAPPVLEVTGLVKDFHASRAAGGGAVHAVAGVDLAIGRGEIVGLVGESGCGKSTVGRCILRLLQPDAGQIWLDGTDITRMSKRRLRPLRPKMHMVFQDPYSSLNPRMKVGAIIGVPLRTHGMTGRGRVDAAVTGLLDQVGLAAQLRNRYPHELSGGQRQRVALARSLAVNPSLLVADEPTSALDVSVQAAILNQLAGLHETFGFSCLLISHDLAVVEYLCDRVAVMYLGRIVESGSKDEVFGAPKHPYTQALLAARLDVNGPPGQQRRAVLPGELPSARNPPGGCPFHPRCPAAELPLCATDAPPVVGVAGPADPAGHWARCHLVRPDGTAPDINALNNER